MEIGFEYLGMHRNWTFKQLARRTEDAYKIFLQHVAFMPINAGYKTIPSNLEHGVHVAVERFVYSPLTNIPNEEKGKSGIVEIYIQDGYTFDSIHFERISGASFHEDKNILQICIGDLTFNIHAPDPGQLSLITKRIANILHKQHIKPGKLAEALELAIKEIRDDANKSASKS